MFRQRIGGPIGLLLTGTLSRIVMSEWDKLFLLKLGDMGIEPLTYFRYVDDQGLATWALPPGARIKEGKLEIVNDENEKEEEPDERTARIYREVANTVMPMIQLVDDFQSKHECGRIPVLDLEVWVEENRIHHTLYRKPMASKKVVSNRSALEKRVKHNILVEEGMRRQRHVSKLEEEIEREKNKEEFLLDMREGGYPERYRNRVMDQIEGKIRKEMENHARWEEDHREGKPMYRTGKERDVMKNEGNKKNKEGWYKKGGYTSILWIPATPEGELLDRIKLKLEEKKNNSPSRNINEAGTEGGEIVKYSCNKYKPIQEGTLWEEKVSAL